MSTEEKDVNLRFCIKNFPAAIEVYKDGQTPWDAVIAQMTAKLEESRLVVWAARGHQVQDAFYLHALQGWPGLTTTEDVERTALNQCRKERSHQATPARERPRERPDASVFTAG